VKTPANASAVSPQTPKTSPESVPGWLIGLKNRIWVITKMFMPENRLGNDGEYGYFWVISRKGGIGEL
jgi:hypothetical protein